MSLFKFLQRKFCLKAKKTMEQLYCVVDLVVNIGAVLLGAVIDGARVQCFPTHS